MSEPHEQSPFIINIREGGLECEVTVRAGMDLESTGEAMCLGELRDLEVEITSDVNKRVAALLLLHETDKEQEHSLVVAQGQEPRHGKDGRLELNPKLLGPVDADVDELGCNSADVVLEHAEVVDHHDRSAFILVEAGERLGTLHEPVDGVDGRSVKGETIAAKVGKALVLNTDESVVVKACGAIEAAMSGVVVIDGKKIRVLQKLEVHGNVDFHTGNIDFPGDVVINKGVKDCFNVQASCDIIVRGLVEAASIHAGRDLELLGGAACREKGELSAVRDIRARYLNECDLRAGRNLTVEKEIINAHVAVGADLLSPNCTIIGGSTFVTGSCDIEEIGSERNIPTQITLGKEREAARLTTAADELLEMIQGKLAKSQSEHDQLQHNTSKLTPTQAETMTELQFEIGTYSRLEGTLSSAVSGMDQAVGEVASVDLTVQRQMWRGVTIVLGDCEAFIEEPIKGPFRISLDSHGKPILTDLISDSSVELSAVARVRSRIEAEGADEAIAA